MKRINFILSALCSVSMGVAAPEKKVIDGITYHLCKAQPNTIKVIWKDDGDKQLRTFPEVAGYLTKQKIAVDTLMNGGIFEPGGVPSGLLIQDGKTLRPVNTNQGAGNFFLKPNGIFLISSKGAAIVRTEEFAALKWEIQYAVQSGPLLLRHGQTHPVFRENSTSRLHRNGVGVTKNGEVIFAMTDFHSTKFPNLHEFAQLFRHLGCDDALFLDGDISQMRSGQDLMKPSNQFGSIIAVIGSGKNE